MLKDGWKVRGWRWGWRRDEDEGIHLSQLWDQHFQWLDMYSSHQHCGHLLHIHISESKWQRLNCWHSGTCHLKTKPPGAVGSSGWLTVGGKEKQVDNNASDGLWNGSVMGGLSNPSSICNRGFIKESRESPALDRDTPTNSEPCTKLRSKGLHVAVSGSHFVHLLKWN